MKPSRLGRIALLDDHDAAYAEDYYASGQSAPAQDRSPAYDYRNVSNNDLAQAEGWARYRYQTSGWARELDRLRAIHAEQQRRLDAARGR